MQLLEFIQFVVDKWQYVIFFCTLIPLILYFDTYQYFPSGKIDAFHFFYAFNLGIAYGVVASLYYFNQIENYYFFIILYFAVVFHFYLKYIFKRETNYGLVTRFVDYFMLNQGYFNPIKFIYLLFFVTVCLQIFTIGISAFTEINRFEDAKGLGFIIRILEPLKLIVISHLFINILIRKKNNLSINSHLVFFIPLCIFLALLSGAKFALIEILLLLGIFLPISSGKIKLGIFKISLLFTLALAFVFLILFLNNKDEDSQESMLIPGVPFVVDKLFLRLLSDGDMYYLSLPNGVIDEIQTDNVMVRFTSQILGNSLTSKIFGYDVSRFSVGKAIQIYHHESIDVAGGPVSHIDLFAYKYLGFFLGTLFIIFLLKFYKELSKKIIYLRKALILEYSEIGVFNLAVYASLWMRSLPVLMEPPVGCAYIFDFIFLIIFLKLTFKRKY